MSAEDKVKGHTPPRVRAEAEHTRVEIWLEDRLQTSVGEVWRAGNRALNGGLTRFRE